MSGLSIGMDYTPAVQQTAGIGRYVRELTHALSQHQPGADVRLFVAGARAAMLDRYPGGFHYRPSWLSRRNHERIWYRLWLPVPVELWIGNVDVFHGTDFALPPTLGSTRTVLTVPDLAYERYPEETMPGMLDYLQRVVPRSVRRADQVIAISEATRRDIVDIYGVDPDDVTAVPLGVDEIFTPQGDPAREAAVRQRYHLPDGPLVLTVGTMQPRKNHLRLVQAFAQVDEDATLVIAGGRGWAYDEVYIEASRLKLGERVVFTGFVDDSDLPTLYRSAALMAYPALYEGFGLPLLEAMACGTPVLTSNVSSLPEVAGEAALLVDPEDVDAIAEGISRALRDDELRADLRARGIERAASYTWERTARETWAIYERLAG